MSYTQKYASLVINMNNSNSFEPVVMSILVERKEILRELRKYVEW